MLRATTPWTFSTSQLPRVLQDRQFLTRLTSKCASRHKSVHFFEIWTSKSGPNSNAFNSLTSKCASRHNCVHFFDISTFKSVPKVLRTPQFLTHFTSKCAAQLLGIWEFLSPKVGDKNSQTVGGNNSIPMGIIIVPNFSHRNLIIVPNFLGIFVPKKVGGQ